MATLRTADSTIVTLLGTVNTAARTATQTINAAAGGLDMLDAFVQKAKRQQANRYKIEEDTELQDLVDRSTLELSRRQHEIAKELASDAQLKALYDQNRQRIAALFQTAP